MSLFTTSSIKDFPHGNILLRDHHAALLLLRLALVFPP
jgi:hypothetical protein